MFARIAPALRSVWDYLRQSVPNALTPLWLGIIFATLLMPGRFITSIFFCGGAYLVTAYLAATIRRWPRLFDLRYALIATFFALCGISMFYGGVITDTQYLYDKILDEYYYTVLFFIWSVMMFASSLRRQILFTGICWLAVAGAVANLGRYFLTHDFAGLYEPIEPLGILKNANMVGLVYATFGLFVLDHAIVTRGGKWFAGFLAIALLVLFTYSRVAIGGLICASILRVVLARLSLRCVCMGGSVFAVMLALAFSFAMTSGAFDHWIEKGTSHRVEIWRETIDHIRQAPFFGHGLAANFKESVIAYSHPHNLWLALLYYTGALGFGLFLCAIAAALLSLIRNAAPRESHLLLPVFLFWFLASLVEGGKIVDGSGGYPLYFWLPIALLYAVMPREKTS